MRKLPPQLRSLSEGRGRQSGTVLPLWKPFWEASPKFHLHVFDKDHTWERSLEMWLFSMLPLESRDQVIKEHKVTALCRQLELSATNPINQFYRWRNWVWERLTLKVIQLVRGNLSLKPALNNSQPILSVTLLHSFPLVWGGEFPTEKWVRLDSGNWKIRDLY